MGLPVRNRLDVLTRIFVTFVVLLVVGLLLLSLLCFYLGREVWQGRDLVVSAMDLNCKVVLTRCDNGDRL